MRKTRKAVAVSAGAAALLITGGIAYGAITTNQPEPGAGGTYTGCYDAKSGSLRLLTDIKASCSPNEKPAAWDQGGSSSGAGGTAAVTIGVETFGTRQGGNAPESTTISNPSTGHYVINFDPATLGGKTANKCATTATLSRGMSGIYANFIDAPSGEIATLPAFGDLANPYQVVVSTYDSAGVLQESAFWLVLYC